MRTMTIAVMFAACIGFEAQAATPMVDGRCSEYTDARARTIPMRDGLVLHVLESDDAVWLCVPLPAESLGMLDLVVESEALERPLNLHVSAQLGEWPEGDAAKTPTGPDSPLWWNHQGWTANWLWFHGMQDDGKRPNFAHAPARELQLSKQRFGPLPWKLSFSFMQVRGADGDMRDVQFPAEGRFTLQSRHVSAR